MANRADPNQTYLIWVYIACLCPSILKPGEIMVQHFSYHHKLLGWAMKLAKIKGKGFNKSQVAQMLVYQKSKFDRYNSMENAASRADSVIVRSRNNMSQ